MDVFKGLDYEEFRKEGFEVVKASNGYYYVRPFPENVKITIAKEAAIKRGFLFGIDLNIVGYVGQNSGKSEGETSEEE